MAVSIFYRTHCNIKSISKISATGITRVQRYAKKQRPIENWMSCRRADANIPPKEDPDCPLECVEPKVPKKGVLHWIKMKLVEGGTNFGTPFRRVECKEIEDPEKDCVPPPPAPKPQALPAPIKPVPAMPEPRPGVQVTILGADSPVGYYVAMMLKQCPCIYRLRLYDTNEGGNQNICRIVHDLRMIDTNCFVEAFGGGCNPYQLDLSLQNTDIVLMLDTKTPSLNCPLETRFALQAPRVKMYADSIGTECPKAFVIVCVAPIDCMVPLVSETMKEIGWYDPRKILGSMAVPEMRASTLAARALSLEPRYTRVPCVGGTEGETLVPLFSQSVEYFEFARHNAELMTETIRYAAKAVQITKPAELSEAHALAGLVKNVAHALLCQNVPKVSGFVLSDPGIIISPAKYFANEVLLNHHGICANIDLPPLSDFEKHELDRATLQLHKKQYLALDWYYRNQCNNWNGKKIVNQWFCPTRTPAVEDAAYMIT